MKFSAVLLSLVGAAAVVSAAPNFRSGAAGQSAALSLRNVDTTDLIAELYSRSLAVSSQAQEVEARDLYDEEPYMLARALMAIGTTVKIKEGPAAGKWGVITAVDATGYTVRVNMGNGHTQDFEVFHDEVMPKASRPTRPSAHH